MVAGMWKTLACLFESDDMYSSQVADTFEAVVGTCQLFSPFFNI